MSLLRDLDLGTLGVSMGLVRAEDLETALAKRCSGTERRDLLTILSEEFNLSPRQADLIERGQEQRQGNRRSSDRPFELNANAAGHGESDDVVEDALLGRDPDAEFDIEGSGLLPPAGPRIQLPGIDPPARGPGTGRYRFGKRVGKGGSGIVRLIYDQDLGRFVALKTLKKGTDAKRKDVGKLVEEVQITAQLEHPNIPPVHDIGVLPDGQIYYTMKLITGRTLDRVLAQLNDSETGERGLPSLNRLLGVLLQVCQGVAFAHSRGVIHRDLKPANIIIGDFGEVYILDWGLAKLVGAREPESSPAIDQVLTRKIRLGEAETMTGVIKGTPAYMAPEQAKGRVDRIDERTDVYALGAILYEILTLKRVFPGREPRKVIRSLLNDPLIPPRIRSPDREIPEELERICLRCLSREQRDRYPNVPALQSEIEAYLEGSKRREAAARFLLDAVVLAERHGRVQEEYAELLNDLERVESEAVPWAAEEEKWAVWEIRDRVRRKQEEVIEVFAQTVNRFEQALSHDPGNRDAQRGLADLYWSRFREAEIAQDPSTAATFRNLVAVHDDGTYARRLQGDGTLTITCNREDAVVSLAVIHERSMRRVPGKERVFSKLPVEAEPVAMGGYMLYARCPGYAEYVQPIHVSRCAHVRCKIDLVPAELIRDGFIHIPAGPAVLGGDPMAVMCDPQRRIHVLDFCMARFPITRIEYLEFINSLVEVDPVDARFRAPRTADETRCLFTRGDDGLYFLPELDREGEPASPTLPVVGVSYEDAVAYTKWRARRDGVNYRLLTDTEWEKAARGPEGRFFPWGNHFDPSFCKNEQARPSRPSPEEVGAFHSDISPYGVRDMAGGVQEWCDGWFRRDLGLRSLRGGAWSKGTSSCRSASRFGRHPKAVSASVGFRIGYSLRLLNDPLKR